MQIVPLAQAHRAGAARILREALGHMEGAYNAPGEAEEEVARFLHPTEGELALAAVDGETLLGWIGALTDTYDHAWELHPLVVDPPRQRRGVGAALTRALEERAAEAGIGILYLGTDDDFGGTNLFGADLFPDVLAHAQRLEATGSHPVAFYRRLGYAVVGLLPDVNGPGKPDILMAKRIARRQSPSP